MSKSLTEGKPAIGTRALSKRRKRELLCQIAENAQLPAMVRIRAIEIDSKLAGHYAPDRLEVSIGPATLEAVTELVDALVAALHQVSHGRQSARPASEARLPRRKP